MGSAQRKALERQKRKESSLAWKKQGPWQPLELIPGATAMLNCPRGCVEVWKNDKYIVQKFLRQTDWGVVTLYMVRRNDAEPIHSWSDMQRVKNQLAGTDRLAVEVYPEEENMVDVANIYHLWVLPPGFRLPFGLHLSDSLKGKAFIPEVSAQKPSP